MVALKTIPEIGTWVTGPKGSFQIAARKRRGSEVALCNVEGHCFLMDRCQPWIPAEGDWVRDRVDGSVFRVVKRTRKGDDIFIWDESKPNCLEVLEPCQPPVDHIEDAIRILELADQSCAAETLEGLSIAYADPPLKQALWAALPNHLKAKLTHFKEITNELEAVK